MWAVTRLGLGRYTPILRARGDRNALFTFITSQVSTTPCFFANALSWPTSSAVKEALIAVFTALKQKNWVGFICFEQEKKHSHIIDCFKIAGCGVEVSSIGPTSKIFPVRWLSCATTHHLSCFTNKTSRYTTKILVCSHSSQFSTGSTTV